MLRLGGLSRCSSICLLSFESGSKLTGIEGGELDQIFAMIATQQIENQREKGRYRKALRQLRDVKQLAVKLDAQLQARDEVERQLQAQLAEQAEEIPNLKDVLRKLSLDLPREESDNSRVAAKLQMKHLSSI
jgi:predicted RNase H-like nuclease (RuvC/YqgF family)